MSTTPGEKIINEVSMPLAQTVFQKDFDAETGEALRSKTLELLLALDVIASASHDLAQISKAAADFKGDFEKSFENTYMRESVFNDFKNLRTSETEYSTVHPQAGPLPSKRVVGVSKVERGDIVEVDIINPEKKSGNPNEAPFMSEPHAAEVGKQEQFRNESISAIQSSVRDPLLKITTLERLGKGGENLDTSLSKSFLMDPSFNGVLNDTDKKAISDYADKHKLKVQESEKDATDYMKQLSDKSDKNQRKFDLEEQKRSKDIETETSKEESAPTTTKTTTAAPSVMVTGGGGGGGSFSGGRAFGSGGRSSGGGGRQNASFGSDRRKGEKDIKSMLENSEKDGEIDIDKLLSDMLEENKKEEDKNTVESVTSSLPEGTYSVVNGPDGEPMGYKVNEELGGGVFLFDAESGKSTALMMTNKENVFMDPNTEKYYQMDFPDQGAETSSNEDLPEDTESEKSSPTITEIESDAEPVKKEIDLSTLNQDMLQEQGLLRTEHDGETFYSHYNEGKIEYMVDENGKRVDQSIIDEINSKPENISVEEASSQTFDVPPSLSERFLT